MKQKLTATLVLLLITSCRPAYAPAERLSANDQVADAPQIVFAIKTDAPPAREFKTDDVCWKDRRENGFMPADASKSLKKQSSLALCYDARNLYIMMEFMEPDVSR
ncbi:MAG: hypothetical protein PHP98_09070, partial [Kiritimatiellae bacterium]|nr:hypothetical protein [Kiritimatiellia bacterium]